MRFLALTPGAAAGLLAAVLGLILLFYLLKPRPRRVVVASNFIWNRLLAQTKTAPQRWRWWLSFLLASLIGLGMALALTRPDVPVLSGEAKRIALVVDNAPSMATHTRDGKSRWWHAVSAARELINHAGVASEFIVSDTMGFAGAPAYLERKQALAVLDKLPLAVTGQARFPVLPTNPTETARQETHLFSDGVARYDQPQDSVRHSVFESADNAAVVAFDARAVPNDPTRYQAFVQVFNASLDERQITLEITGDGGFSAARNLSIPAGATANETIDVSNFAGGVLRASIKLASDAYSLDDQAYAVVQPHHSQRILLVTRGNTYLLQALRLLPGVDVSAVTPALYKPAEKFDAYVFDRYASAQPPLGPVLLFRPPSAAWLPAVPGAPVTKPTVARWDESHPLAKGLSWKDLQLEQAVLAPIPEGGNDQTAVVIGRGTGEGALIVASDTELRTAQIGFALEDSNLQFQADFPIFLGNTLRWLTAQTPPQTHALGPIEVRSRDAHVTDREGKSIATVTAGGRTIFAANRPNVFTVKSEAREFKLVANVLDPSFSTINDSNLRESTLQATRTERAAAGQWHPWALLLLAALILVSAEWLLFHRRVTV